MVVVNGPVPADTYDTAKPIVYAPLAVSGLVVGFNLERVPNLSAPLAEQSLTGVRVANMNLTPRVLAKLLTQSYVRAMAIGSVIPNLAWLENNPLTLGSDPDFLQFNPEFRYLQIANVRNFSQLSLPSTASDAATQVWKYILADPEARAWLSGTPDKWGMKVNPIYSTNAQTNPTGTAFGDPIPNTFPKSDPYCYQAPNLGSVTPAQLCGTDWVPYNRGYSEGAQMTRFASDSARVEFNIYAATAADAWKREVPQALGTRSFLSLTDTSSAERFGLQVARLSRAGDNGTERSFLAPTPTTLGAGVAAMVAGTEPTVLEPKPDAVAPGAYPLTLVSYAAISPLDQPTQARKDYAAFIKYAVQAGQVPGLSPGELPRGYAPLPDALKTAALSAAERVLTLRAVPGSGGGSGSGSGSYFPPEQPTDSTLPTEEAPTTTVAVTADTEVETALVSAPRPSTPSSSAGAFRFFVLVLLVLLVLSCWVLFEVWARSRPTVRRLWPTLRRAQAAGQ
jgi:hypothetical protein